MAQVYKCPEPACAREFETVSGWKRHMSTQHNGWSDEQLMGVTGYAQAGLGVTGEESFESYAAKMPASEKDFARVAAEGAAQPTGAAASEGVPAPARKPVVSKKIKADMRRFKRKLSYDFPKKAFDKMAEQYGPMWKLDDDDADMIADAVGGIFEGFGVEFQIEQKEIVLQSRFWLFLYPALVFAVVLLAKFAMFQQFKKPGTEPEADATTETVQ